MNTHYFFSLVITFFSITKAYSQDKFSLEQFLVEDGLPHNIVNQVIQDKKGFIWLATTNGLSRYDGYNFRNYKPTPEDKLIMKNNRVNKITEDTYGRIWMRCEAIHTEVYSFNPNTESYWGIQLIPNFDYDNFNINKVQVTESGSVWILSKNNGCIRVKDSLYNTVVYQKKLNNLHATTINAVHEDSNLNSWLLTNKGLTFISSDEKQNQTYYKEDKDISFYSSIETKDEIWFGGTDGTIAKYSKGSRSFRTHNTGLGNKIIKFERIDQQTILAISDQNGFCTININNGEIKIFNETTVPNLISKNLIPISFVKKHLLWFVLDKEKGIYLYNFRTNKLKHFNSENENKNTGVPSKAFVLKDPKGNIWVQPYGGLFSKFDPNTDTLTPFKSNLTNNEYLQNSFHTAFFDKQGFLWFNVQSSGLLKVIFNEYNFNTSNPSSKKHPNLRNVRSLFQDKKNNIWVGTKQNQLIIYDEKFNEIGVLSPEGNLNSKNSWPKAIYTIIEDSNSNIWIGTRGDGLYKLIPTKQNYQYKVLHFTHNPKNSYSLSNNAIYSIFEDMHKQIWVGTFGGLNLIKEHNSKQVNFINHLNKWKNYPIVNFEKIRCINQTQEGILYIGTTGGLLTISQNDQNLQHIEKNRVNQNNFEGLKSNDIIDICVTKKGEVFLATADGGLSKVVNKNSSGHPIKFKNYNQGNGLASNNLLSIIEDNDGKIWITTDYMVTRFDTEREYFELFPEIKWTLSNNNFAEATKYKLNTGKLLFGYSEGILHFYPDQIKSSYYTPYLAFTDLLIFNKKVDINKNSSPLKHSIDGSKNIVLSHNQNFFNIQYSTLDYKNPENIKYAYILEGFDEEWNYVNNQKTAHYTNVPKGNYIFKVKSTNGQGNWINNERNIPITIKPSIWNTPTAYILYTIVCIAIILLINHTIFIIYRLKTKVKMEKEMFSIKQKFFIDISHELRTPLTLISGPIEYLINDNRTPEIIKKQLTYISQSTDRLQRLVNQILDFRKIQDVKLKISKINLSLFINEIYTQFTEIALEKGITFTFENISDNTTLWADKNGLEKIVMNLLSNAFKYTPNGKSIVIKTSVEEKFIGIHIIDEGVGISKENHPLLFTRFVAFNKDKSNPSTGIGLSMVKEIIEKHQGKINFESEENKGSTFSVFFKNGYQHFSNDVDFIDLDSSNKTKQFETTEQTVETNISNKIKILVIEDDEKLRTFIKNILEHNYEILEAEDGEKGYQMILDKTPNFVISDIMMPKLNGVDLLKRIRKNIETSHVPVILLTAKTNIESKLEGLSYGADDYITKPFSVSYLKARIINLLEQRKRLQNIYNTIETTKEDHFTPKPFLITDQDEDFMSNVMTIIDSNMDNNSFSVEILGSEVGLNRTSFYYKIKSLTGLTPVEFIRDIRLKRASQLISESDLLIKEIAYMTGFSDIKYFNKSFKNKYNTTPTEYRKKYTSIK